MSGPKFSVGIGQLGSCGAWSESINTRDRLRSKRLVDSHAPADSIRGATVSLSLHKYGSEAERDSSLPIAKSIHTTVKMLVSPDASV